MRSAWFAILLCGFALIAPGCGRKEYTTGQAVFQGECVKCHRMNGAGGKKGPELTDVFARHDEEYIRTYIMDPRSIKGDGIMPPAEISEKELSLIVEYLKSRGASH
jgi:cytochrome c oxidase subunit 2